MSTAIFTHSACLLHDPAPLPGFAPARLVAVVEALRNVPCLDWHNGQPATREQLALVHTPDYIAQVLAPIPPGEQKSFDFETFAMSATPAAALTASGLAVSAVRAVMAGEARNAFCLASPGGHHAEAEMAQGFCFFNHVALAAAFAQAELGVGRVAVLDFDAHHGNGTQSLFWNHADRMLVSLHEDLGLSGFAHEQGAHGNILNIPLATGSGSAEFHQAITQSALPALAAFQPELMLVSAGFDMCEGDPLAGLRLRVEDYGWIGGRLATLADAHCAGRLVAVMEGGYNLATLGDCAAAFVRGLMNGR